MLLLLQSRTSTGMFRFSDLRARFPEYRTENSESGRRKFERDKEALSQLGVTIEHLGHDEEHAYRLNVEGSFLCRPVDLTPAEKALLAGLAAEALDDAGIPYLAALRVALSKLGVSPVTEESFLVRHPVRDPDRVKTDMVEVLGNAVLASKRVSFEYTSTKGSSSSRTVEPYGLFLKRGHWYLCGRCETAGSVRVFRLSRARELKMHRPSRATPDFEVPADFTLDPYSKLDPIGFHVHEPMTIEVRVEPRADHLAKLKWGEPVEGEPQLFLVETTNLDAVIDQVLQLGKSAEILGPQVARDRVCELLEATLRAHGAKP